MAQHDYVIDNGPGLAVRTDINAALAAIQSSNSGTVEPAAKVPGQFWFNTTTGQLVYRNSGNTAWNPVSGLSSSGLTLELKEGTTVRGSIAADGGANPGTTALRAFNNTGAQVGLFYLTSSEIATDRNTISVYNAADQALWFRKTDGNIRSGVYSFTGGSIDLRAYNTTSNTLSNILRVGADKQNYTQAYGMTYNSDGAASDVYQNHRVSSVRATRLYFSQSGDFVLQQSDDNFASHFINIINYVRSSGITFVTHLLGANGVQLNGTGGSGNGLYNGTGDGASLTSYNVMLRSWYGIGFPSSLDNINRIWMNTRNGDMGIAARLYCNDVQAAGNIYVGNGASTLQTDGNIIFSSGMTSVGATLHQALSTRSSFYTGSTPDELNFPLGHELLMQSNTNYPRNSAVAVYLYATVQYSPNVNGTALSGTWRVRGAFTGQGYLTQRVA